MAYRTAAVVVGVNRAPGQPVLRNAENDARDLAEVLGGPGGPIAPEDVVLLIGRAATRGAVRRALLDVRAKGADVVLVFFAGHGDPSAFWFSDTACDHEMFADWVRETGASRGAVLVDACHAGAVAAEFGFDGLSGTPDDDWQTALATSLPGVRLLLASQPHESSSDGAGRNGLFTSGLLRAFRSLPGKLFPDGRRYLSAEALFASARRWVVMATGGKQTPLAYGSVADFPIGRPVEAWRGPIAAPVLTSTRSGSDLGLGKTVATGVLLGLAAVLIGSLPSWDPNVARYRRRDGRFW